MSSPPSLAYPYPCISCIDSDCRSFDSALAGFPYSVCTPLHKVKESGTAAATRFVPLREAAEDAGSTPAQFWNRIPAHRTSPSSPGTYGEPAWCGPVFRFCVSANSSPVHLHQLVVLFAKSSVIHVIEILGIFESHNREGKNHSFTFFRAQYPFACRS